MGLVSLHGVQEVPPGTIIVSDFNWKDPTHWIVRAGSRSRYCHATVASDFPGKEWSVHERGTILRPLAADPVCYALVPKDPNWRDILKAAADYARKHPVSNYNWGGAAWTGVQILQNRRQKSTLRWPPGSMFCFEWVTDIYEQIGFDVVPDVEPGNVIGDHLMTSSRLVRL